MSMAEKSLPHLLMRSEPWRLVPALLAFFLYRLFGMSELCARLPSFVAGVLTIPLLYLLARHWMKTGYALAAAAILALSTFHLWYSQLSTSYAPAMFFILLSMLALERVLADDRPESWFRWGAALLLALVTHFQLALFVLVAQGLRVAFPRIPGPLQRQGVAKFCIVSAYSWAIAVTVFSVNAFTWSSVFAWSSALSAANMVPHHVHSTSRVAIADFILFVQWLGNAYSPWYLQLGIGVAVVAGLLLWSRRDKALTIYLLLPTALFWLLFAVRAIRLVEPRYSLFTLIPLCILGGTGIAGSIELARLRRRGAPRLVAFGLTTVLLGTALGGASISLKRYTSRERFPFRATARLLAAHVPGGEKVYFCGFGYHQFKYYYPQMLPLPDYHSLERAMDRGEDLWIVYYEPDYLGKMPDVLRRRVLTETTEVFSYEGRAEQNLEEHVSFVRRYDRSSVTKSP